MTRDEISSRVKDALARVLKAPVESIAEDASQMNLADWDSVKHMNVVLALENDFDIEFGDAELPNLNSVPKLVEAVERHIAA
jgi:acyl carrier protein